MGWEKENKIGSETMLRLLILSAIVVAGLTTSAMAAQYKVMIVTWRGCEEACRGFQDYLTTKKIKARFLLRDAGQSTANLPRFLAEAKEESVDLILTWGTTVTLGMVGSIGDTKKPNLNPGIPTVFMIVADPVAAGIVKSLDAPGRPNVTGTYNRVPEAVNIATIRTYLPSFKRLGLLYNADEKNSVLKRDELAKLAATLKFELVAKEIPLDGNGHARVDQIGLKMAELKVANVDFLYIGSSSFLRKHRGIVTGAALDNGIPVLSPYEEMVRDSQALVSVAARYYDIGQLAGRQAERILVDRVQPRDLPVAQMTDFAVVINLGVAKQLKRFPPIKLLQVAETVN
jgi:putative ABC transport system substrate-binding protein